MHASDLMQKRTLTGKTEGGAVQNASTSQSPLVFRTNTINSDRENTDTRGRTKLNNIDLNSEYDGSQDCLEGLPDAGPLWLDKDSQQSSPPQNSGNSGSTSSQSPSTSSGDTQVSS